MSTAHKYLQRIISAVLILVMVFGLVGNVPARAEDTEENNQEMVLSHGMARTPLLDLGFLLISAVAALH